MCLSTGICSQALMLSLAFRDTPETEAHRGACTHNLLPSMMQYSHCLYIYIKKIKTYLSNRAMFLHAELTSCDTAVLPLGGENLTHAHKLMLILNHMQTAG